MLLNNPVEILGYQQPRRQTRPEERLCDRHESALKWNSANPTKTADADVLFEIPGSEFTLDVDTVVISIGTSPNPLIKVHDREVLKSTNAAVLSLKRTPAKTTKERGICRWRRSYGRCNGYFGYGRGQTCGKVN